MSATRHFADELIKLAFSLSPNGTTVPTIPNFNTKNTAKSGVNFKPPAPLKTPVGPGIGSARAGMKSVGIGGKIRGVNFMAQGSGVPPVTGGIANTRGSSATGLV